MIFAINQHESALGTHVSPIMNPPSHIPSQPIPLGCPISPALNALLMHRTCSGHLFYIW